MGLQVTPNKQTNVPFSKKPVTCFYCDKLGHVSRECRSRIATERQTHQSVPVKAEPQMQTPSTTPSRPVRREVTCWTCQQKGHKSPQCPQRLNQVKRVQIPSEKIVPLRENELFDSVGSHRMPITCDSGADISVVPEDSVTAEKFTGTTCQVDSFNKVRSTGKLSNITITIDGTIFKRKAVTQPGKDLAWTACLSVHYSNKDEKDFIAQPMDNTFKLLEEQTCYLPPEMKNGILNSGLMVSEGTVVTAEPEEREIIKQEIEQEQEKVEQKKEEVEQRESDDVVLVTAEKAFVDVEEVGELVESSAEDEGIQGMSIQGITHCVPRNQLAQATLDDPSLEPVRILAAENKEGYHFTDGILFRTRLDQFGQAREQICLPKQYRSKCITLAHNHFGYQGRNKMVQLIRPFFHWPTITKDCLTHVRNCDTCQRMDKSNPRHNTMQAREVALRIKYSIKNSHYRHS